MSLLETLQSGLAQAVNKARYSGEFAEDFEIAMIDTNMGAAIEFIKTSRRIAANKTAYPTI